MCSEASVLGVPSIYCARVSRGYIQEQDRRYGLVRQVTEVAEARNLEARLDLNTAEVTDSGVSADGFEWQQDLQSAGAGAVSIDC